MLIHIVMHIDSFKELLTLKVPRSWGSCEIRNTLVDRYTLITGAFELPINVVVFGEHRIQSVGTSAFPLLPVPPSSACGGADYHTIYLHCIIALKWKEVTLPSVSVRTEPAKRIKHNLLSPKPKRLEFFHREFELSCMLSPTCGRRKPTTWTVIGLEPDRVKPTR